MICFCMLLTTLLILTMLIWDIIINVISNGTLNNSATIDILPMRGEICHVLDNVHCFKYIRCC